MNSIMSLNETICYYFHLLILVPVFNCTCRPTQPGHHCMGRNNEHWQWSWPSL